MDTKKPPTSMGTEKWDVVLGINLFNQSTEQTHLCYHRCLEELGQAKTLASKHPYCLPLYLLSALRYSNLGYPDLAAGAAYKALLLSDAVQDEADEFHEQAVDDLNVVIEQQSENGCTAPEGNENVRLPNLGGDEDETVRAQGWVFNYYLPIVYHILTRSLLLCCCYQTAFKYYSQATKLYSDNSDIQQIGGEIRRAVAQYFQIDLETLASSERSNPSDWPDTGFVRRERYPWNNFEPDRLQDLPNINALMADVAPKLEVRAVDLPSLSDEPSTDDKDTVQQLGVFAKEDFVPGEIILNETSMLTANNKLQDALCDACSADLPELESSEAANTTSCPDCEVVYCSQDCYEQALELYHPALCGMDVEAIAKDVPPAQAADSLYSLLLLRALAMAQTQHCHPLELKQVKYVWGDFHSLLPEQAYQLSQDECLGSSSLPKTLPFSFEHNIRLPFHMLEKMDIDIFANPQYDVWVLSTLYAKFRGTASARLSGLGGRAVRGPEVSAVHPTWCLANHSCDPNVSWEWGGSIKFSVREQRVSWAKEDGTMSKKREPGIRKGEEVLNHYCDIDLPVKDRREWARGALGGDCRCERCIWEAGERGKVI